MTEADNVRNFFLKIDPIDRRFEVLVLGNRLRRVVDGIAAENEQLFDAARIHFRGQLQNAVRLWRAKKFPDRKSTRLNSSHSQISYAVFCLNKNKLMD